MGGRRVTHEPASLNSTRQRLYTDMGLLKGLSENLQSPINGVVFEEEETTKRHTPSPCLASSIAPR